MSTLSISLPANIKEWVERHAQEKGYATADKFLLDVIKREQAMDARERINQVLLEAMNTESTPMTKKDWQRIRAEGVRRFRARQQKWSR